MVALVSFDMVNESTCRSETESCETKVSEIRNDLLFPNVYGSNCMQRLRPRGGVCSAHVLRGSGIHDDEARFRLWSIGMSFSPR